MPGYRITYISAIDAKPSTKQFANTTRGNAEAMETWQHLASDASFAMFAVMEAPDTPRKYYTSRAVKNALVREG